MEFTGYTIRGLTLEACNANTAGPQFGRIPQSLPIFDLDPNLPQATCGGSLQADSPGHAPVGSALPLSRMMSQNHINVIGTSLTPTPEDKVIEFMMYKTAREVPIVPSIRVSSSLLAEPSHWYS